MRKNKEKKPKKKGRLSAFVIGNVVVMMILIILGLNIASIIVSTRLIDVLCDIYISENAGATRAIAEEAINHNELSPAMSDKLDQYNVLMIPLELVIISILVAVFVWIIMHRVNKELKSFEVALDNLSESDVGSWDVDEINSNIQEFDSICVSYNRMVSRLRESEAIRSKLEGQRRQLTADISHDLKTPITVIHGYAQALKDGVADREAEERYLDAIYTKTDMIAELINTFHEYSKLDHPNFEFDIQQGDICEYFREYLAIKYEEFDLAGFELDAELPEEKIICIFDHTQLKRVFENLITNSLRHNTAGTCIYADLCADENSVTIHIGDTGKGIPKELRDTIFEPFVVGNSSRTSGKGSGLGLAISKRIVEAHGGSIKLIDDPRGVCSTYYEMILPRRQPDGQK